MDIKQKQKLEKIREYKKLHGIDRPLTHFECIAIMSGSKSIYKPEIIQKKGKKNRNKNKKVTRKTKCKLRKKEGFYDSREWRELRYKALKLYGRKCVCCGRMPPEVQLHVDHIKPRSKYPELELDIKNLQIFCKDCNLGKSNYDEIDYR